MKKILMFGVLLFSLPLSAKAINVEVEYIDGVYSNRPVNNQVLSGQLGYISVDNSFAYCLDPSLLIVTGEGNYSLDEKYLEQNFSEEQIKYLNLVAYFGYEFPNHNHEYYYMAAQELIWEYLYNKDFYWTTEKYPNGTIIDIEKYKEEIVNLIENKPFFNKSFEIKLGKDLIIEDETNTLEYYEAITDDDLEITKDGNKLTIKAKKAGDFTIKLQHKSSNQKPLLIFSSPNHQTLGSLGSDVLLESQFTLKVTEEKKEEPIIEDVLPNTTNTNLPLNISSFGLICLGFLFLRKSY